MNVQDVRGAIKWLLTHATGDRVGTVGFCMGGQLSLFAACANPQVGACVNFYGIHPSVEPNLDNLRAPVLGFFAEHDEFVPPAAARQLETDLREAGKQADITVFSGADHAFFNDTRVEVYHQEYAEECWDKMIKFYREQL